MEPGAQQGEGRPFRLAPTLRQIELPDDLKTVFAFGTNPQRKHLLHQTVKEVRVNGGRSVEVTYFVAEPDPGRSPVRTQPHLAPQVAQSANRRGGQGLAVFRVLYDLGGEPSCAPDGHSSGAASVHFTTTTLRASSCPPAFKRAKYIPELSPVAWITTA